MDLAYTFGWQYAWDRRQQPSSSDEKGIAAGLQSLPIAKSINVAVSLDCISYELLEQRVWYLKEQ